MKRLASLITAIIIIISCTATVSADQTMTVSVCVYEQVANSYLFPKTSIELSEGATVYDALKKTDLSIKGTSTYVSAIGSYAEFGHGKKSGWTYYVNDEFPSIPAGRYRLKNGDSVRWVYVIDEETAPAETSAKLNATTVPRQNESRPSAVAIQQVTAKQETTASTTTKKPAEKTTEKKSAKSAKPARAAAKSVSAENETDRSAAADQDMIAESLRVIKNDPSSFTPLTLALYTQAIPSDMKNSVIEEKPSTPTAAARIIINANALGLDAPEDTLKACFDSDKPETTGVNGIIFSLIAACRMNISDEYKNTVSSLSDMLVDWQNSDGGFPLEKGGKSECDLTAMAVTALSCVDDDKARSASENALSYLSSIQNENGSFSLYQTENCESTAQVVIALSSAGVEQTDERFVKSRSALQALYDFYNAGIGFSHEKGGDADPMSCEQALLAIYSAQNMKNPYSASVSAHIDEINFPLIIIIVGALIIISGTTLFILTKKSKKQTQAEKTD